MKFLIITQTVDENDQLLGFFVEWIRFFSRKFEKITVLCLEKGKFNFPENVEVISLGKDRGAGKLKILFTFYFLLFTHRDDYDSVFAHMNPIWVVLGGLYWRLTGKNIFFWYTHKAVTLKLRLAEKFADVIFTASKESFRLSSKKIIVTGHGIDTDLFKPNNPQRTMNNELKILSVGRIAPVKNYETLIEASKLLKNGGVNFSVTMIGEAPLERDKKYEKSLKFKVKSLGLEEDFNFVGKMINKDLPAYYQSHHIFIHLSKTGSLDKTILEAMACGMKVLSSNDSSRAFLPANLIFEENDPVDLVGKIMAIRDTAIDANIRGYVVKYHSLDKLINKLSKKILDRTDALEPRSP